MKTTQSQSRNGFSQALQAAGSRKWDQGPTSFSLPLRCSLARPAA
jgi:hypothetical protein